MQQINEPQLTPDLIRQRADGVMAGLRRAAEAVGRDPQGIRLVAVTKGFGVEVASAAVRAGLGTLGENRVQEALPKIEALAPVEWHLIGRLQSNKARAAVRSFAAIHSVDSLELLARLDRIAAEEGRSPALLLQVNVSGEAAKAGFAEPWFARQATTTGELVGAVVGVRAARIVGLMTMAPMGAPAERQRAIFGRLRELRDLLQAQSGRDLPELSMGMTADAVAAVTEGSTLVRIGTAIFGPRPHP